ncbi:MAG: hypothetical protein A3B86_02920 [Candidatus Yanofskybacteria bacterium RIFCSPHIGHO2_02_FULL_38_22b]|uniref:Bacterial type II secretion system protein E domain-containing protein n=1 Tax=Candidatus Yanofskybacteria bacterium RIFCSPHIGHO2_02_FULL_38_22b TaxID=1802673 RepID=A0A1F8F108_9BACT|nr:MAG: hypothetical protein A2816_02510 [Candidatus Yanofskybacteria bacterium RIFCSPHIGHO2_01_FULL_39_44]OGN06824.1 MAG: hypothetical protein A3B86_02920 [Candidatus Yanofskybacteria bacterium RIFCSPHIGHO2_02_FULL_38_22b]OGN20719.1 MAG: hypothetical protein A2910_00880 [Candidatus Yanofskybacteria bacterium RIFCSPLOWO2_01_FULL_39_28]
MAIDIVDNPYKKEIDAELAKSEISIINLVSWLLAYACDVKASDIHIDTAENNIRIRFRIDGILKQMLTLPSYLQSEIISRIKILSHLRTDEHQATQDGRFKVTMPNLGIIDIRVATTPTYHGESVILRILSNNNRGLDLDALGFCKEKRGKILDAIKKTSGMILATGPTGSGKTSTLYSILKILNTESTSIITLEDPIEYSLDNIRQIPVNNRTGLNFNTGLRSILRQDPDIIMVGEIRDEETANLAVNSSLTGHLLLSTLHTSDAATTLPRLLDMKIEPYLISSTVNLVISQRLVRKICPECKVAYTLKPEEITSVTNLKLLIFDDAKFYKGTGCPACDNTGYKDRVGIYEVMVMNDDIRQCILRKESAEKIKKTAMINGMETMFEDGLKKAAKGITTIEEVLRVISE